ncbi:HAD-IIIC family phosphatase [Paraburkholderia sp. SIMBA_009]|uniref:HAD superfamily phosphatase (TIGR01681 family)/FkbH-like protein n=1 Tax=Paraburkholderia tropica TaxID=92647 RepID=A0ABX5MXV0_9BURK|nr:HAD-IIIC family phosphatase [Paraburkholderia tropica]PXX20826.1 HAD superfamily phosphatase (TIGR01681 family)/FkbH-like protein [Paraburkholderia tropica]PZW89903.1 HAD superfamily phosphatase (TIGR01681 family)/FkbH-like protein [Paraburkholderia tropica]
MRQFIRDFFYTSIADKQVNLPLPPTSLAIDARKLNILLLGTCGVEILGKRSANTGHNIRHIIMGSKRHEPVPVAAANDDVVVVNLTLRHILSEAANTPEPAVDMLFARLKSDDEARALLASVGEFIALKVGQLTAKINSVPILFMSFFEPSFNYLGDLIDPSSLTSPSYLVREINRLLFDAVRKTSNGYFLDANEILNFVGRRHLQDDVLLSSSHASFINDWDFKLDASRLNAPKALINMVTYEVASREFTLALLARVEAIVKIVAQRNPVKLIIVDLDDTLWRGVAAEGEGLNPSERIEGWPIGLVEALLFYKKRGGLLAICSKNDEAPTIERFNAIWRGAITLDDFASVRINWQPKSQNIREIMKEVNLLPGNCVFIDDNDRELSEVKAAIPEIRCLGGNHYDWRRIILRSAETQVPVVTEESARRTELVRAISQREASVEVESGASREAWLASLQLRQSFYLIKTPKSKYFERAFELINKTNQFNTTGKRWEKSEFEKFISKGGYCIVSSLRDKLIDNGIISVCLIKCESIVQVVLSCRVFGLGAELVVGAVATRLALKAQPQIRAELVDTGKNATCHDYFERIGFSQTQTGLFSSAANEWPSYIQIENLGTSDFPPVQIQ